MLTPDASVVEGRIYTTSYKIEYSRNMPWYAPEEYCPTYAFAGYDATAVPLEFGSISYG